MFQSAGRPDAKDMKAVNTALKISIPIREVEVGFSLNQYRNKCVVKVREMKGELTDFLHPMRTWLP